MRNNTFYVEISIVLFPFVPIMARTLLNLRQEQQKAMEQKRGHNLMTFPHNAGIRTTLLNSSHPQKSVYAKQ